MEKRVIPSSGEKIATIGLGTYKTFDTGSSARENDPLEETLRMLAGHGGNVIDSSPMYGRAEEVAGRLLEKTGLRNDIFLATKVWTTGSKAGIVQMNQSFRHLRTNVIDLMQIHNLVDWKSHLPVLNVWKASGRIRYTGITHYHSGAYAQAEQVLRSEPVDFLQINYSINQREAEKRLLPLAAEKGIAVIINMPFDSGALFSLVKNKALPEFAGEFDCQTWAQYFLKFILSHPAVTCVIPATTRPHHLGDFIKAGSGKLPDEKTRTKMVDYFSGTF